MDDLQWDKEASDKIKKYIAKIDMARSKGVGLFMFGRGGVGKTLSACLILKEILSKGYTGRFTTLSQTIAMISDGLYDKDARELFQQEVMQVDFLVLDDIDKMYHSDKTRYLDSQTDVIFRQRANYNLPIIVTSNKARDEVAKTTDQVGELDLYGNSLLELFAEHLVDIVFTKTISRRQAVNAQQLEEFLT
jgi:DNA replication protein DnaC